jgi:hypothetical protein
MASVNREEGRRVIQFVSDDQKRRSVRLGKCEQRTAEGVRLHVERLIESQTKGMPLHSETSGWLPGAGMTCMTALLVRIRSGGTPKICTLFCTLPIAKHGKNGTHGPMKFTVVNRGVVAS